MIKKLIWLLGFGVTVTMAAPAATITSSGISPVLANASASPYTSEQQSVLTASEDWQQAIDARNPKAVAALYDQNAYFYPTFTKEINKDPQGLYQYFVNLCQKPQLQVIFDQENPRVYGDGTVAVNSGLYTFSYRSSRHHTVQIPARFTFVYVKENGQWMIVEHHSSVIPVQPRATSSHTYKRSSHKSTHHKSSKASSSTKTKSTSSASK